MSGLTDGERARLEDLERSLAEEDPSLAARLAAPARYRLRVMARIGCALCGLGIVLMLCGDVLETPSISASGCLLLAGCWVPWARARRSAPPRL